MGVLTALAAALAGCGDTAARSATPTVTVDASGTQYRDQAYVDDGNPRHLFDLAVPPPGGAPAPLVVFVHGGGWRTGDKSTLTESGSMGLPQWRDQLLAHGYAVASVNYRLSGDATYPAPIHDVKAAVRHLRANAARYGLDPARFVAIGESAGGHLALLLAMTPDDAATEGTLGTTGVSSRVSAVVSYYGLSDLVRRSDDQIARGCSTGKDGRTSHGMMLGAEPTTPQGLELARRASPLSHVTATSVPTLLFAGSKDCTAPVAQSQRMDAALRAAGATSDLVVIDAGHAEKAYFTRADLNERLLAFLARHLAP